MKTRLLIAAALSLAACGPAAQPSAGPAPARPGSVTEAGLLRLADRRDFDEPYLRAALAHADPAIVRRAAWVLANLRHPQSAPLLAPAVMHADTSVQAMAMFALGQLADSVALPLLVPYADVSRAASAPTVAQEAAYALGKTRSAQARAALVSLLSSLDRDDPAHNAAAGAALLSIWRQGRPLPVEAIDPWIRHADSEVRWRAAYSLARRPEPASAAALFRVIGDPEPLVRSFAARALTGPMADSSGIGRERALEAVVRLATDDPASIVRINALRTLGTYPGDRTVRELVTAAGFSEDPYEVIAALEGLQRLGPAGDFASRMLMDFVRETERPVFVRQTALAALAAIDREQALEVARVAVRDPDWRIRASAARAFAQLGDSALADLAAVVASEADGRVVSAALEDLVTATGDRWDDRRRALVLGGLRSADVIVRTNALSGIARMADTALLGTVLDAYGRAAEDEMNDAALSAVDALAALARRHPDAARRFFARYPRSADYLVRQRLHAAFGDTVPGAWGPPLPIETGLSEPDYARIADSARARPRPHAVIRTSRGEIEVELFADDAPLTVRSFLSLAGRGFFDGQEWPRVVPNFVIQGGDPRGDTSGGPGYSIRDEINRHLYLRGSLGMALSGPDTGGSQWFVTHSPQPHLDGTYAVFGRVVRGMEVADRILPGDRILSIREVR